jgi:hypothetical protein
MNYTLLLVAPTLVLLAILIWPRDLTKKES